MVAVPGMPSVPRMAAVVLVSGVMLPGVVVIFVVVVVVARRPVVLGVLVLVVQPTHSFTSVVSRATELAWCAGRRLPGDSISTTPEGVEQQEHDSLTARSGSAWCDREFITFLPVGPGRPPGRRDHTPVGYLIGV